MGYYKKQKERLEAILAPLAIVGGAAAGMYLTKGFGHSPEDVMLRASIVFFSAGISGIAFKLVDDIVITQYYRRKADGYTPKGIKKYIFRDGKCVDIKKGKDLGIKCYERDI